MTFSRFEDNFTDFFIFSMFGIINYGAVCKLTP